MRYFGREKLADMIRQQIGGRRNWRRRWMPIRFSSAPRLHRFRWSASGYKGTDDDNRRLLETVNDSGEFFLSHTVLRGQYTLHLAIGNMGTTRDHVMRAWEMVRRAV